MATEKTSREIQKVIERMKEFERQKEEHDQMDPISDDDLDFVAGGYYNPDNPYKDHTLISETKNKDGSIMYVYTGTDRCSCCLKSQRTLFYQLNQGNSIYVMCETCLNSPTDDTTT